MGSNFKVKIDPYVIAKVDDIDYYYFEKFGNFEMGILLTKELKDVKETIQDNPYIGRRIDDNIYKYVMLNIKSVLYSYYPPIKIVWILAKEYVDI